jgi:hypothetical protein
MSGSGQSARHLGRSHRMRPVPAPSRRVSSTRRPSAVPPPSRRRESPPSASGLEQHLADLTPLVGDKRFGPGGLDRGNFALDVADGVVFRWASAWCAGSSEMGLSPDSGERRARPFSRQANEENLVAGSIICAVEGLRNVKSAATLGVSAQLGPRRTLVAGRRLS